MIIRGDAFIQNLRRGLKSDLHCVGSGHVEGLVLGLVLQFQETAEVRGHLLRRCAVGSVATGCFQFGKGGRVVLGALARCARASLSALMRRVPP